MDSLREKSFSGLDSFFEPEQPKHGGRRILLLVVLLAALGGAAWWTYTNYLGATERRASEAPTASIAETPAEKSPTKPAASDAAPSTGAGSAAAAQEAHADNAGAVPTPAAKAPEAAAKPAPRKITPAEKSAPKKHETKTAPAKAPNPATPATADAGDATFRRGVAYLYGRGAPKNCDEAIKYLKSASANSNAKARSTFGTMYATGHCVTRDLPTSYLWFALALRADPNNQILEKDLSAIWNQMTPPERQMATRMKQ